METIGTDVRFALRSLRKRPLFAFTAVFTLALGIGANASIFTVTNGLVLTALPYAEPDELVTLKEANPDLGWDDVDINPANAWDWRERSRALDDLAGVIQLAPQHISWYQLTLEPNTLFHQRPPSLPGEDDLADMMEAGQALLTIA